MDLRDLSLSVISASLYALLVLTLAPISYGPIQLRVADCLIPLAAIFGWPSILGVTLGCFVGNAYYWLGFYDIFLGPLANLIAASLIFFLRKRPFFACLCGSFPIGLIVGGYLWTFFPPPDIFGLHLPLWIAMITSITISTLIAVAILGYTLLKVLSRPTLLKTFQSHGVKTYSED